MSAHGTAGSSERLYVTPIINNPLGNEFKDLDNDLINAFVDRASGADATVRGAIENLRAKNQELAKLTKDMEDLRNKKKEAIKNGDKKEQALLEEELEKKKAEIEKLSTMTQTEMLDLQKHMFHHNNAFEAASGALKRIVGLLTNLINNATK